MSIMSRKSKETKNRTEHPQNKASIYKLQPGAREMKQHLRVFDAFPENPSSIPNP